MVKIINQQKIKRVNLKSLSKYLKKVSSLLNVSSKKITVVLCDNRLIKKLNKKYLGKDSSTDVLAFPLVDGFQPDYLGEVIVSLDKAVDTSARLGIRWQDELLRYIIHGFLHFSGYDDRTNKERDTMAKKQEKILKALSRKDYIRI